MIRNYKLEIIAIRSTTIVLPEQNAISPHLKQVTLLANPFLLIICTLTTAETRQLCFSLHLILYDARQALCQSGRHSPNLAHTLRFKIMKLSLQDNEIS